VPACAPARRGAALFQLLLTIGLVAAALIGLYQAQSVEAVSTAAQALAPKPGQTHCLPHAITHGAAFSGSA
jgi:type II secretory pathway component PulK